MKPHLTFLHQNYPAQFGPVSQFLIEEHGAKVSFLSQYITKPPHPGIQHLSYQPVETGHEQNSYFFSRYFEQEAASMHGILQTLQTAKIEPDCFIGHTGFGTLGLLHASYPKIPTVGFFELFYNPYRHETNSRPEYQIPTPNLIRIPLRNATQLVELEYCTKGYTPTPYQKSTYPQAYQDKLSVLFDGIDVHHYHPGEVSATSELVRTWSADAKLVTYVARGLEAIRGFDVFMKVAHRVAQKRPDVHFVVAGNPKTHYGAEMLSIKEATFKEYVLKQEAYDLSRFHFLDWISEPALADLFRLSDCHFYWTIPFVLSWSLFQAMASGCLVVASDTEPVQDIVLDGDTGLLAPPYDIDALTSQLLDALEHPKKYLPVRQAARELMVQHFSFEACLPKLADFYLSALLSKVK